MRASPRQVYPNTILPQLRFPPLQVGILLWFGIKEMSARLCARDYFLVHGDALRAARNWTTPIEDGRIEEEEGGQVVKLKCVQEA